MSEQVNLDELDRKARAAEADEWRWDAGVLEGVHNGQVVLWANLDARDTDEPALIVSVSDAAHIAAASPPVVRALIARIRELESGYRDAVDELARNSDETDAFSGDRELLAKGVVLP